MVYNPGLDGIRAVACLAVVAHHCWVPGFAAGGLGVDVFFVLSGYLITQILTAEHSKTGHIDFLAFYVRRIRRLYPALLLLLVTYLLVAPFVFPEQPSQETSRQVLTAGLYLSDYSIPYWGTPTYIANTWSLAVEEHFYLIWPLFLLGLLTQRRKFAIACLLLMFVVATTMRFVALTTSVDLSVVFCTFHYRCSGLILGAALGLICRWITVSRMTQRALLAIGMAGFLACCATVVEDVQRMSYGILLAELSAVCLILGAHPKSWLSTPWLVRIGVYSYAMYLWNGPVSKVFRTEMPWPLTFLVVGGLSLAFAAFSYHFIEMPFRRRKLPNEQERPLARRAVRG